MCSRQLALLEHLRGIVCIILKFFVLYNIDPGWEELVLMSSSGDFLLQVQHGDLRLVELLLILLRLDICCVVLDVAEVFVSGVELGYQLRFIISGNIWVLV